MRKWALGGLVALAIVGCRTHTVDDCRPACDADDQTFFAHCVASGSDDPCEPGNRRCCALAADCLGNLDDQTVVSSHSDCESVDEDACFRPCMEMDTLVYNACFSDGTPNCAAGDFRCCALSVDCLGDLGDVIVTADGCCATAADCASGQTCSNDTWTCSGAPSGTCGDGVVSGSEQCDDHNTITEECAYGMMSCSVCDSSCHTVAGVVHFCGDGEIESADGETCDPPDMVTCDTRCRTIPVVSCTNDVQDGMETDVDCGGTCTPCEAGERCNDPSDCQLIHPECDAASDCSAGVCVENSVCSDDDDCTDDPCDGPTGGCADQHPLIDRDMDLDPPDTFSCGHDCDDHDPTRNSFATEICGDGIDQDCDDRVDEGCP